MIRYAHKQTNRMNDGFSQSLQAVVEGFQQDGVQVLGEGFKDVLTTPELCNDYFQKMTEGLDADTAAELGTLMENSKLSLLESSLSTGITPISSLTLPTLRKTWPKLVMTKAVPTEVVEQPKFTITYMTPWIKGKDGVKRVLPEGLTAASDLATRKAIHAATIAFPQVGFDVLTPVGASVAASDSIDVDVSLVEVTMDVVNASGASPENKTVAVSDVTLDTQTNLISAVVSAAHSDGTVHTDTVFVKVDRATGLVSGSSVAGKVDGIKLKGYVSSEMNNSTDQVGFDMDQREVHVPTGAPLAAPVPSDYLMDLMKMFSIDGVSKVVDIMSSTLAQKCDFDGLNFLKGSQTNLAWVRSFSATPPARYTGSPTEWRTEIRTVIDNLAQTIQNDTTLGMGYFVVVGNPIDTALIPSVDWQFTGEAEVGGVPVDYNVGYARGAQQYVIVSSKTVPTGELSVHFVPTSPDQMTYKFYPYSFTVHPGGTGYVNPTTPNVPAVIANRRYTYQKMVAAIGKVTITNNNGVMQ